MLGAAECRKAGIFGIIPSHSRFASVTRPSGPRSRRHGNHNDSAMASDEPLYLTVGTDVSAKYRGAFCEAKIKKVNRMVKCRVTFKNNHGTHVIPDDHIKGGTLRVSASPHLFA
uniref:Putative dna-binding bright/brcaa1/rbp1 n=1 Tax=Ixodes ricinus TaxID=34613 RepID=A0A0K8R4F9_IXORI